MISSFWIMPHISSFLNALLTFALLTGMMVTIFLKPRAASSSTRSLMLLCIMLACIIALLFSLHPVYKKIYDQSLISTVCLAVTFGGSFIAAFLVLLLCSFYYKTREQSETGRQWVALSGIFVSIVFVSFCLGGVRQKSFSRDLTLKVYSQIAILSLGGEGEIAILKKHPELLDHMFEYLFLKEPEKKMLDQPQFIEQMRNIRSAIHKERVRYYRKAPDTLLAQQFTYFVGLAKTAIHKDQKNCTLLLMHDSVEHLSNRDNELNVALQLLDNSEKELIEKTSLSQPDIPFSREEVSALIEETLAPPPSPLENGSDPEISVADPEDNPSAMSELPPESSAPSPEEDMSRICLSEFSDLVKLAALPESKRAQVARFMFIGENPEP